MSVWELLSSPEAGRSHHDGGRHGAARHGGGPVRGGGDAVGGGGEAERERSDGEAAAGSTGARRRPALG